MIKLIKRLFRINRYFLVFFYFVENNGITGHGHRVFCTNGKYINTKGCVSMMKIEHTDFKSIIITNIIELTERERFDLRNNEGGK